MLAEQAEALVPYLVRYQPARWRATVVPLFVLCAVGRAAVAGASAGLDGRATLAVVAEEETQLVVG